MLHTHEDWLKMKFLMFLFVAAASAQPGLPIIEPAAPNLPAQRIGPNDLIAVAVYDSPEFTRTIRAGDDGKIRLPMLKRQIDAMGLRPDQLEQVIRTALEAEHLILDPVVTVTVIEYHSRPVSVSGAVRHPITFQAITPVTLLSALGLADGLSPDAGSEIIVTRKSTIQGNSPAVLVQRIAVRDLFETAAPEVNVILTGGEEIRIPQVGKVYVVGNVKRPGAFRVEGSSDTTVLQVLALAEGLAPSATKQAYILRRELGKINKTEIRVELKDILDRKSPDVRLQVDDILYVPDDAGRRTALVTLEKIIGFGTATAAGMLTWGIR